MIINNETLCRVIFVVLVMIIFPYGFVLVTLYVPSGLCSAGSNGSSDWLLPSFGKIKVRKSIGLFTNANLDCCSWI